jgi:hypothetical protein
MMLAQSEIPSYLLKHKLLSEETIVEDELLVLDTSRRNRNFKVIRERGPCYLLKQGIDQSGAATIAHEAAVYQLLQSNAENSGLDRYLPRFYEYDPEEGALVLELLRNAQNLREYHAHRRHFSVRLASAMGEALSTLHSAMKVESIGDGNRQIFSNMSPWVFSIHRPPLSIMRGISGANVQLIKIVQQFPEFREWLNSLHCGWKKETLIHGDMRWDNWIVCAQSNSVRKNILKIVDWEFVSVGDPCWDVGAVFSDYLSFWLLSIPILGESPPDQVIELSRFPLEGMQPAMRSFWWSYVQQMELNTSMAEEWLLRAIRYAAGRLVQTAYEQVQREMQPLSTTIYLLQLSLNMLRRPLEAIVQLLGIPLSHMRGS